MADLRITGAAEQVVEESGSRYGRLDCVVSNAGLGHDGPAAEMTSEEIAELVDVNARAPMLLARAAVGAFMAQAERSQGDLPPGARRMRAPCFVTPIAAAVGVPAETVYSATKAAVETFAALLRESCAVSE